MSLDTTETAFQQSANPAAGREGELTDSAAITLLDMIRRQEKIWKFPARAVPEHGVGHIILPLGASTFPQTAEMENIMDKARYQGDMQYEFFVLGIQETLTKIHNKEGLFWNRIDLGPMKNQMEQSILRQYYMVEQRERGKLGNKSAFFIGKNTNPRETLDAVKKRHIYRDMDVFKEAKELAKTMGLSLPENEANIPDWIKAIKDGDTYTANGEVQTYHDLKSPDFLDPKADQTWKMLVDRAATFIHTFQDEIRNAQSMEAFLASKTVSDAYSVMLTSQSADPVNRNFEFEKIIGYNHEEPQPQSVLEQA